MAYDKKILLGKSALVVEDYPAYAEHTTAALQSFGMEVHATHSVIGALVLASKLKEQLDVAVVDVYLPLEDGGIDRQDMGIYLSAILKRLWIDVPIIAISNYVEEIPRAFDSTFAAALKKRDVFMQRNGIQLLMDAVYSTLTNSE